MTVVTTGGLFSNEAAERARELDELRRRYEMLKYGLGALVLTAASQQLTGQAAPPQLADMDRQIRERIAEALALKAQIDAHTRTPGGST